MQQRIIFEGNNDLYTIIAIWDLNLKIPKGFNEKNLENFGKTGGSFNGAIKGLKAALNEENLTNIGIIVDADKKGKNGGVAERWQRIHDTIKAKFPELDLRGYSPNPNGIVIFNDNYPTIGVWIMPDNQNEGYLEHFLAQLIDREDVMYKNAVDKVSDLYENNKHLKEIRKQKANIYTWLAWQEEPGQSFGTAVKSNILNAKGEAIQPFLNWIKDTFDVEVKEKM